MTVNATPRLIVHGGAGDWVDFDEAAVLKAVRKSAEVGWEILKAGGSALDAVEKATNIMEDDPQFDSGFGSFVNAAGEVEMDALIADGSTIKYGAVAAVRRVQYPISLARLVMTRTASIGAVDTHAATPSGLDGAGGSGWTTPHDLAVIFRAAMANPVFAQITAQPVAMFPTETGEKPIVNQDELLVRYPGAIGGKTSAEFQVLAQSGEDAIAFCPDSDYAANIELAKSLFTPQERSAPIGDMQKIATPGKKTCAEVADFLQVPLQETVKTLAVKANDQLFLLLLRGDHQLNELKVRKIPFLSTFQMASEEDILRATRTVPGYIGPVGLQTCVIADQAVMNMSNFVCGANEEGFHLTQVNFVRDVKLPDHVFDIRNVVPGDDSPDGKGKLEICRGIEVGHIFQLRTKYSEMMKANYLDETGQTRNMEMGCYGIGISRIVAAAIEQNHDEHGIIFPDAIAPFQLAIVPIGLQKSTLVKDAVEKLYRQLAEAHIEVLLDDREERPGVMFADMELIGIPHRIVIGERGLKQSVVEYQGRNDQASQAIPLDEIFSFITTKLCIN